MPSYLREPDGSVCWNCNREADAAASLTVRTPAGAEVTFALCRRCSDAASAIAAIGEDTGVAITRQEGRSGRA